MSDRFQLEGLEVSGFRGVRDRLDVPLDKPLNLVAGQNGSGKSTLLTAIEWALFPKEATTLKDHDIGERRDWQVRHVHGSPPLCVVLRLRKNADTVRVEQRGLKPAKDKPAVRCSYADFKSLVFIHQETLRDFLVGPPEPRQQMFQRLLGAGWVQDLVKNLEQVRRDLRCDDADERVKDLDVRVNERMSEAGRQFVQAKARVDEAGFKPPWEEGGRIQAEKANGLVESVCQKAGISVPPLPAVQPLDNFSQRLSGTLSELRRQGPASLHAELASRKTRIETARSSYDTANKNATDRSRALVSARERFGSEEQIAARTGELAGERGLIDQRLSALNREREVISKAMEYLASEGDAKECPVCLRAIERQVLLEQLRRRLETALTQEEKELHTRRRDIDGLLQQLSKNGDELNRLSSELGRGNEQQVAKLKDLEGELGRQFRRDEDALAVADAEIRTLEERLKAITEAVDDWQKRINDIETEAKKVGQLAEILRLQERLRVLEKIRETREWQIMADAQSALSRKELVLRLAEEVARRLAAELARRNLERAQGPIASVYRRLTQRHDFPDVGIDPDKKYEITVKGGPSPQSATAVLNVTDLNALAVAVIAGMAISFPEAHDLDFLILDDPSQGMDPQVARRLGDVISDLSERIQILVGTPDADLLAALEQSPRQKNVIRLKPRDPDSLAPGVQLESAS